MYQYDDFDRQFVTERVAHYREQTERYLAGKLSEDEFLQLRLRNGRCEVAVVETHPR